MAFLQVLVLYKHNNHSILIIDHLLLRYKNLDLVASPVYYN
jgi:hypothetical protein